MEEIIKKAKIHYYVSAFVILFSLASILVLPFFINDYMWFFMLIPLFFQIPNFLMARSILKKIEKL